MNIFDYINDTELATLIKRLSGYRHISTVSTGLAVKATSDPDFKTTATMYYLLDGVLKSLGAAATIDASGVGNAPFAAQAAGKYCAYVFTYNGSAWNIYKGEDASTAALAITSAYWPDDIPATEVVVGYFVVATAAGYTYQCGVTNTDATGITVAAAVELATDKIFTDMA